MAVPLADLVPAQPSFDWPPPATQLAALDDVQLKVTDFPTVTEKGVADNVTVGTVTVAVTVALALTRWATQFNP